jgi:hypothetical protein
MRTGGTLRKHGWWISSTVALLLMFIAALSLQFAGLISQNRSIWVVVFVLPVALAIRNWLAVRKRQD